MRRMLSELDMRIYKSIPRLLQWSRRADVLFPAIPCPADNLMQKRYYAYVAKRAERCARVSALTPAPASRASGVSWVSGAALAPESREEEAAWRGRRESDAARGHEAATNWRESSTLSQGGKDAI